MRIELISNLDDDSCAADQIDGYSLETRINAKEQSVSHVMKVLDCFAACVRIVMRRCPSFHHDAQLAILQNNAILPNKAYISPLEGLFL